MKKEKKIKCWIFHDWNKWTDLPALSGEHVYIRQIKECKKCGIKKGRSRCYVQKV